MERAPDAHQTNYEYENERPAPAVLSSGVCTDAGSAASAYQPRRLKNCTSRSCFSAAARVVNVPKLRRWPVFGFLFDEERR